MKIISPDTKRINRLAPGQYEVEEIPVLDLGNKPNINKNNFRLELLYKDKKKVLDFNGLISLPEVELYCDLHCVTTWSKFGTNWKGVSTKTIYDFLSPVKAKFVLAYSYDGYSTNMPIGYFLKEDSIIAYSYENGDIPYSYGGPARLLIPSLYYWKSAKWLSKIEFMENDKRGYWEERGYHDVGDPFLEQRRRF
ncbi:MAG TPA: molybdopterin-dependent oxidoreductase [Elusimicrobiales bacterium]|nr:molybdopterin-dependent oxidoreductase [Elusimicrobiales bacterium]HOL62857.1 molybdopterin-dependent oxidoreductase [Elusimicrobiales bacterium]HPO95804.1 molybdopterin-dependent oxidoreductase [Elusimicrobiales bacterium]